MTALSLSEKLLLIEEGLTSRRIPHAFGGAIALAYYATPRATIDIDLNVFVPVSRADEVLDVLATLGSDPLTAEERERLQRDEQARLRWDGTPIDLFFAYDAFHDSCLERRRVVPFGEGDRIHVLSAEDLVVFKVMFDRGKDWRDIGELTYALAGEIDAAYVQHWLDRILEPDDPRRERIRELLTAPR
jgi:hypothetical protein